MYIHGILLVFCGKAIDKKSKLYYDETTYREVINHS